MDFKTSIFAILAIFCVILSACAVSAVDNSIIDEQTNDLYLDDSHDGHDGLIIPPDNTHDEARHAAGGDPYLDASQDGHNGAIIAPDAAHDEAAYLNATHAAGSDVNNSTNSTNATNTTPAAGSDVNNSTNSTNATNTTPAAGGEVQNTAAPVQASSHTLHATGNPILALLAVGAVLGGVQILRRK